VSRDAALLLRDIEDACEDVAQIVAGIDYEAFANSIEKVAAVERKAFVIGGAAARLPDEVRDRSATVPWRLIIGMRNILAHAYWRVDRKVLWDAATRSIPALLVEVRELLKDR
jgi:uncharacterized protein with HEPN domain